MKRETHAPWMLLTLTFFVGLLAFGAGPVGLAVLVVAALPLGAFLAIESIGHQTKHITH